MYILYSLNILADYLKDAVKIHPRKTLSSQKPEGIGDGGVSLGYFNRGPKGLWDTQASMGSRLIPIQINEIFTIVSHQPTS